MLDIKIFKCKNKRGYDKVMDIMSQQASAIYKAREDEAMEALENDVQKIIFMDWRTGGSLWDYDKETKKHVRVKRYKHVSDHDWDIVHGYIMETVSMGMG